MCLGLGLFGLAHLGLGSPDQTRLLDCIVPLSLDLSDVDTRVHSAITAATCPTAAEVNIVVTSVLSVETVIVVGLSRRGHGDGGLSTGRRECLLVWFEFDAQLW